MVYSGKRPASMAQLQSSAKQQVFDEQHSTAQHACSHTMLQLAYATPTR